MMKKFEMLQELPNVTQRHKVSKCCWRNGTSKLASRKVAANLQFVKKNSIYEAQ